MRRNAVFLYLAAAVLLGGFLFFGDRFGSQNPSVPDDDAEPGPPIVTVALPQSFSARANLGRQIFEDNCVVCHGKDAAGQEGVAPPLIHMHYRPDHHDDEAIQSAVARGVKQHHWTFGDMPPVEGISRREVVSIVAYIRELQRANGIN